MMTFRTLLGILLAFMLTAASAQDFVPVPPLTSRVTDMAGMLDARQRATLENVLKDYEDRTGSQIAILLVNKTEPEAIEQYSIRVYDAWQLGRKGVDDGVLLLVAKDNPSSLRRLRIEAGRGVQGSLTDAQSKRILQDVIAPHFRQNDFYGGLAAGVSAITSLLDKERFPSPQGKGAAQSGDDNASDTFSTLLFIGFIVLFLLLSRAARSSRRYTHSRNGWGRSSGIILGGGLGGLGGGFGGGGGFRSGGGGFGGGGFSGGGGSADGGGASGNW